MRYRFKTRPYYHQAEALQEVVTGWKERNSHALLMAPRTGKTKVAIDGAAILWLQGKATRVMVVCPVSVMGVWVEEIRAHCPVPFRIVVWDREGRKYSRLPNHQTQKLVFVLVNYEAFSTPGVKLKSGRRSNRRGGRFEMKKLFLKWKPELMILDESHRIKTPNARKTRMLWSLGKVAKYRLILTGTVLTKKKRIFDIYSQWKFLNPESPLVKDHTLSSFKFEYGVWRERSGYSQWLRNRNMGELRTLLHAESFAVTRDECFDLPPRRDQVIPVELSGHTAEVYDQMAEEMVAMIKTGEISEASIKLVQSLRLSQITSGITRTTPTASHPKSRLIRIGKDKLIVLEELLKDLFEAEEKVVIGARWKADIGAINQLCKKLKVPVYQIHGGVKRTDRDRGIKAFGAVNGAACMVMQPAAGGMGIDLSAASIFIWFSLTNSWVDFTQAEDRIALSNKSTIFMYLIARGTIDEVMYDTLMQDGDLAREVTAAPNRLLRNFKQQWHPKQRRVSSS